MKTRDDCREWRELLGAYALDQLQGDERAGLAAHLEGCARCRAELASLQPVARMLPYAEPDRFGTAPQPSPELGRRVEATIAAERRRATQRKRRRDFGRFAFGGAAAAVAVAVMLLFVFGGRSEDPSQQVVFTKLPEGTGISATLEPHAYGTEIHMYVHGVPSGTLCRIWLRGTNGVAYSAGTFRYRWSDDSDAVLSSALDLSHARAIVVEAGRRTFVAPVGSPIAATNTASEEEST